MRGYKWGANWDGWPWHYVCIYLFMNQFVTHGSLLWEEAYAGGMYVWVVFSVCAFVHLCMFLVRDPHLFCCVFTHVCACFTQPDVPNLLQWVLISKGLSLNFGPSISVGVCVGCVFVCVWVVCLCACVCVWGGIVCVCGFCVCVRGGFYLACCISVGVLTSGTSSASAGGPSVWETSTTEGHWTSCLPRHLSQTTCSQPHIHT